MFSSPFSSLLRTTILVVLMIVSFSFVAIRIVLADMMPVIDEALPEDEKSFSPAFPGNDAVQFADAYGDRASGEHGTFGRFPANFETPLHIHSHSYRAVVLKGEMTNPFEGEENPPVLKPGSFWSVAAETPHTTACVSDTPCEFFMYGSDSFDFVPSSE